MVKFSKYGVCAADYAQELIELSARPGGGFASPLGSARVGWPSRPFFGSVSSAAPLARPRPCSPISLVILAVARCHLS